MKKLLVAVASVLVAAATYGQGQVTFQNFDALTDATKGAIYRPGGSVGAGAGFNAQLFLVGANNALTALTPATTFFTDAGAEFLLNPVDVTVSGVLGGSTATFLVRAWDGTSYDSALTAHGESQTFSMALGGDPGNGGAPTPPTPTVFQTFSMVPVPEPSTIALGLLGAGALLLRRRK